jgi:hypothetical protein
MLENPKAFGTNYVILQRISNMDNNAGTSNGELIWLAGFIDADGSINFKKKAYGKDNIAHSPRVSMTTTCIVTKEFLDNLFTRYQLGHYIYLRKTKNRSHQDNYNIEIVGHKRVKKILLIIKDYLVTKKRESEWMLEYIDLKDCASSEKLGVNQRKIELVNLIKLAKTQRHLNGPQRLPIGSF